MLPKKTCTGCSACMSICPKNCICMTRNTDGFLYPKIDAKVCVNCGLCEKICPVIKEKNQEQQNLCHLPRYRSYSGLQDDALCQGSTAINRLRVQTWADGYSICHPPREYALKWSCDVATKACGDYQCAIY